METRIRLILLDFDGTLADTRRANALAYTATLREAGIPLSEEEYAARYFGMRCEGSSRTWASPTRPSATGSGGARSSSTPRSSTPCG